MAIKCLLPTQLTTNFALCGLFLLIIPTCESQLSSKEIRLRFTRHMDFIKQFPCDLPQPRSIRVEELLGDQLETSEIANPHETVLHRCDAGTGCCLQREKVCKMSNQTQIPLHFLVSDGIRNRRSEFREFMVWNHTKCSCQSRTNDIK